MASRCWNSSHGICLRALSQASANSRSPFMPTTRHATRSFAGVTLTEAQRARTLPQAFWRSEAANLEGAVPGTALCKDSYARNLVESLMLASELEELDNVVGMEKETLAILEGVRCAFMDRFVMDSLKQRMRQVVLLGSGMDSRIYRLEVPPQMRFIEVDEEAVHEAKSETMHELGARARCLVSRQAVSLTPDLGASQLIDAIGPAFNPNKPALFLLDGALSAWPLENQLAAVSAASHLAIAGSVIVGPALQENIASPLAQADVGQVNFINHQQLSQIYRREVPESMKMMVAVYKSGDEARALSTSRGCSKGTSSTSRACSKKTSASSGSGEKPGSCGSSSRSKAREIEF